MSRRGALLLLLAISAAPRAHAQAPAPHAPHAPVLAQLGCPSCHLDARPRPYLFRDYASFQRGPTPKATECAGCHVVNHAAATSAAPPGWLPLSPQILERVARFHAYVDAPALRWSVSFDEGARTLRRFTACGLEAFLREPGPRSPARAQSMFALAPDVRSALLRTLAPELEPCSARPFYDDEVQAGRRAFAALGCASCHAGSGAAPRLRLGTPLLGRDYFAARVRAGSRDAPAWQHGFRLEDGTLKPGSSAEPPAMPPHPDVSEATLRALYAYVATDRSDLPVPRPSLPAPEPSVLSDAVKQRLFRAVQERVFDGSCRHCHAAERRDQRQIQQVFGALPDAAPSVLPMSRLPTPSREALARVLGDDCTSSPLLRRLRARDAEWSGHAEPGAPRGMPLTLPPLPEADIRLVETWRAVGCPSDIGDLCTPCRDPRARPSEHSARK